MATDLSGATLAELQDVDEKTGKPVLQPGSTVPRAELVDSSSEEPNLLKHTPSTYSALTGQVALKNLWQQGLYPTPDDIKGIEAKALEDAQNFQKEQAGRQEAESIARQRRLWELSPVGKDAAGNVLPSPVQIEAQERAGVELTKEQAEQGPSAAAAAQSQGLTGKALLPKLPDTESDKLATYLNGYNGVNDLGNAFNKMMAGGHSSTAQVVGANDPPVGTGGFWRSLGGTLSWVAENTSPDALNFARQRDISNLPIARSVMGEFGATAAKEKIMEQAETLNLPRVQDDELTGNAQLYNFKRTIINNLQNLWNVNNGKYDTTAIEKALAAAHADFDSDAVQRWNPLNQHALVVDGTSPVSKEVTANVNSGANKGLPATVTSDPVTGQPVLTSTGGNAGGRGWSAAGPSQPVPRQPSTTYTGGNAVSGPGWSAAGPSQVAPSPIGAAAQQAGQYAGGPVVRTPNNLPTMSPDQLAQLLHPNNWNLQTSGAQGLWGTIQSRFP